MKGLSAAYAVIKPHGIQIPFDKMRMESVIPYCDPVKIRRYHYYCNSARNCICNFALFRSHG